MLALVRSATAALLLAGAVSAGLPSDAQAQDVMRTVSLEQMEEILDDMGVEHDRVETGVGTALMLDLRGFRALLFLLNENTDGQLYAVFTEVEADADAINDWNRRHRFTRAYLDGDADPVIEADLDFAGGVTEGAIKAWINLYRDIALSYASAFD
jgi:hypothetical protein